MSASRKRKAVEKMNTAELREECKRLRYQVSRRGATIGGLYAAMQYLLEESAERSHRVTGLVPLARELELAREAAEKRAEDRPIAEMREMPDGFACNVCFEAYDGENHRPVAIQCGHVWGSKCLIQWEEKGEGATCPSCRKKIEKILPLFV